MRDLTTSGGSAIRRWHHSLWLGFAVSSMIAMAMPSHAVINECGTDDGTPAGMFNSACAALGVFSGSSPDSGFSDNTAGRNFERDIEAALADLRISVNLESLGEAEVGGTTDFEVFDLSADPPTSITNAQGVNNPGATRGRDRMYAQGSQIVDFLTIKADTSFNIYPYLPAASDGRYSTIGLLNTGLRTANASLVATSKKAPEPASLALLAFGIVALVALRRRQTSAPAIPS